MYKVRAGQNYPYVFVNGYFEKKMGFTSKEILGKGIYLIILLFYSIILVLIYSTYII